MLGGQGPIYQQIARKMKDDILTGALNEDEQVPSTNQLAAFYQVNPATVAKGFHLLLAEGILYKKRGLGMFVRPGAREKLRSERRERFFEEVVDPMLVEATRIGIPIEEVLEHIEATKGGKGHGPRD